MSFTWSVIIPAYNEEVRIAACLSALQEYASAWDCEYEIIVVDDGSSDSTAEIAMSFAAQNANLMVLQNGCNKGKGFSVKRGVAHSSGEWVLFTDVDLSTPITELPKLRAKAEEGNDAVFASRGLKESQLERRQSIWRETAGRTFNLVVRLMFRTDIRDTQCGFKLFRREAARAIFPRLRMDGWAFDVEILVCALALGLRVAEVPVIWRHSEGSKISPIRDGLRMLRELCVIKSNQRRGLYKPEHSGVQGGHEAF
jgi:dolichyl-phosphate beta-glucosyltransferase